MLSIRRWSLTTKILGLIGAAALTALATIGLTARGVAPALLGTGVLVCMLLLAFIAAAMTRRVEYNVRTVAERAEQLRANCITDLGNAMEAMARGDLSHAPVAKTKLLDVDGHDDVAALAESINGMIRSTQATLGSYSASRAVLAQLVETVDAFVKAAEAGQLSYSIETARFSGTFESLATGMNRTMVAIRTPLEGASDVLRAVAARDLTRRMHGQFRGDFAVIADALNVAIDSLESVIRESAEMSDSVASASAQISAGGQQLAVGASTQSARLSEVTTQLAALTGAVEQNAFGAAGALKLAEGAQEGTAVGAQSMERLAGAVQRMHRSSDATAKIVKSIDEIAFQTNLLALNAAVEAARAGDAGRGFAVVADEVRALALRAAEAARQTADLISESVGYANEGRTIADEVTTNFAAIAHRVTDVATEMTAIAAGAQAQRQRIAVIGEALVSVGRVTEETAASAEESASAAQELTGQAESMRALVAGFRVRQGEAPTASRRVAELAIF